ncbi:hypothetical protein KCP75_12835 [Salmonella enterica subsp. enterica]|nr:hypothetical protein KCP75_12835 [Salmonella enterica subsp. enterica]
MDQKQIERNCTAQRDGVNGTGRVPRPAAPSTQEGALKAAVRRADGDRNCALVGVPQGKARIGVEVTHIVRTC